MPHPVWERHLHKREKEREVRMTKAEKGSEIITTICEYENSVAMPDNERLTYLDTCGIARLKDGNGIASAQEAHANRCSEYLRFGHEVDLAACGAYRYAPAIKNTAHRIRNRLRFTIRIRRLIGRARNFAACIFTKSNDKSSPSFSTWRNLFPFLFHFWSIVYLIFSSYLDCSFTAYVCTRSLFWLYASPSE